MRFLKTAAVLSAILLGVFFYSLYSSDSSHPNMTIKVPMRDGTELLTDIYLPYKEAKGLPCIFLRGPGGRDSASATFFANLAKEGYVVAIQDTRSAADKEGKTMPFYSDGWGKEQDGFDAVEYLAKHPLTNGKIGTLGMSNMGITQLLLAPTAPQGLTCQYIGVATPDIYRHGMFPGGQLLKSQVEGWLGYYAKDPAIIQFITAQNVYNPFWEGYNATNHADKVNVPGIHEGGWYDIFLQGTIDGFVYRQTQGAEGARGKQKLILGPWTHYYWKSMATLGDFPFLENAKKAPVDMSPKRWFDHYLKGVDNHIEDEPAVIYYVMGPFDGAPSKGNVWKTSDVWPVPHRDVPFYLTTEKDLVADVPPEKDALITYTHNFEDPVPTIGGRNLFLEAGPKDQRPIESRGDVVVFTTPELKEDTEVTGHLIAKLFFTCEEQDADVAVRLTDVYPDGRSILIADAIHRTGSSQQKVCSNGAKEIDVDLWSTSMVFAKGHRIRVSVAGSNYPRFEVNKTGKGSVEHHLHIGGEYASHIILPVVR